MRILTITNLYPNPYQPLRAPFNRQQFRHLAMTPGHAVRVIAPIFWNAELKAQWRGSAPLPPGRTLTLDGLTVDHPAYVYPPGVLRNTHGRFFEWSVRDTFERAVEEFRPDVVCVPWAYPDAWAVTRLARRAGLPVVVKVHGSDIRMLEGNLRKQQLTGEGLRRADGVIAVSRDLAERVCALGANPYRVRVVYDGVDADVFHPGAKDEARRRLGLVSDGPLLLFIGNLVPVKGLDVLLEALALRRAAGQPFTLFLVGQGPQKAALQQQAERLGLADRVRFLGSRPHDELTSWYQAADLFVLPSRSEGVPLVLLEAIACGTPFVASAVGGIPEIAPFGRSGLVPPEDPQALAAAIADGLARGPLPAAEVRPVRSHAEAVTEILDLFETVRRDRAERPATAAVPVAVH